MPGARRFVVNPNAARVAYAEQPDLRWHQEHPSSDGKPELRAPKCHRITGKTLRGKTAQRTGTSEKCGLKERKCSKNLLARYPEGKHDISSESVSKIKSQIPHHLLKWRCILVQDHIVPPFDGKVD